MDLKTIFSDFYNDIGVQLPKVVSAVLVILLFLLLGKLFYVSIGTRIQKRWKDSIISNFVSQSVKWTFYIFGVIIALNIVGFGGVAGGLIAGAGVSAIIFGFAFKDIGENFLAGFMLALKRPFEIGDIVEVDGQKGTVKDLDLRITHLRNSEGKDIFIPNSVIIKNSLINYTTDGFLRVSFSIGIAPECDIDLTRRLIINYLMDHKLILKNPESKVIVQELGEFTTDLQVFFWVDILANKQLPDDYLGNTIRSEVIANVKRILDQNNIEMPSQVVEHKMYRDNQLNVSRSE